MTRDDRVEVHLGERLAFIFDVTARNGFEPAEQRLGLFAAMGLDNADNDVVAVFSARLCLQQHLVGFADARRGADKDAQLADTPLFAARRFKERLG